MRPRRRGVSVVTSVAWEAYTAYGLCIGGSLGEGKNMGAGAVGS